MSVLPFRVQRSDQIVSTFADAVPPDRELEQKLSTEVEVGKMPSFSRSGVAVLPNRDPVIYDVAPVFDRSSTRDERIYRNMETMEAKVLDARRHLEAEIFAHGFIVKRGPSNSSLSERWQEFAEILWSRIPKQRTVLKRLHDCYYYGWSPLQNIVATGVQFGGRSVWMPERIVNKPMHMVRYGMNGEVVWIPDGFAPERVFEPGPEVDLGWLIWSIGDLDQPYGAGVYRGAWLPAYTKRRVYQKFGQGLDRQMGTPVFSRSAESKGGVSLEDVQAEVLRVVDVWNNYNVVIPSGFNVDMLTGSDFVGGAVGALDYLDTAIQTLITGEILTSNPGDRGTQALGTVQADVKAQYAKDAVLQTVEEPITQLFRTFIDANYGQQEEGDYPLFVSKLRLQVSNEALRMFFDMGIPLREDRLLDQRSAGELAVTEDYDGNVVVKTQAPTLPLGLPTAPPRFAPAEEEDEDEDEGAPSSAARAASRRFAAQVEQDADDQAEFEAEVIGHSMREGDAEGAAYIQAITRDWFKARGLEPPKASRPKPKRQRPPATGSTAD